MQSPVENRTRNTSPFPSWCRFIRQQLTSSSGQWHGQNTTVRADWQVMHPIRQASRRSDFSTFRVFSRTRSHSNPEQRVPSFSKRICRTNKPHRCCYHPAAEACRPQGNRVILTGMLLHLRHHTGERSLSISAGVFFSPTSHKVT